MFETKERLAALRCCEIGWAAQAVLSWGIMHRLRRHYQALTGLRANLCEGVAGVAERKLVNKQPQSQKRSGPQTMREIVISGGRFLGLSTGHRGAKI